MYGNEIRVPVSHEKEPHCIGCVVLRWNWDIDGGVVEGFCNECGEATPVPTAHVTELSAKIVQLEKSLAESRNLQHIYGDVAAERARQDEQWGRREYEAWELRRVISYEIVYYQETGIDLRNRLIKIAALAVAAIESLDRKHPA